MRHPLLSSALIAIAACGDGDSRVPIVVYSPHGPDILRQFEERFEAAHPDVDVRVFNKASQECLTTLRAERRNPRADVFWGAPLSLHRIAAEEGILRPYEPSWRDAVHPDYRTGDDRFHSQFVMLQVIIYNERKMVPEEAPRGWSELITDRWRDRIILRLPPPSGTMRGAFAWLIAWQAALNGGDIEKGFEYLRALHRNTRRYTVDPEALFQAITKDESNPVGIWNFTDARFQRERHGYPLGVKVPEEGVPVVVDCIALVDKGEGADPRRRELAEAFFEFVTSLEATEILAREHYRVPTRTDLPDDRKPDWLRELRFHPLPADRELATRMADEWMTYWDENIKPE